MHKYKAVIRRTAEGGASTEYEVPVLEDVTSATHAIQAVHKTLHKNEKIVGIYYLNANEQHCDDVISYITR